MENNSKHGCAINGMALSHGEKSCGEAGECSVCLDGELLKIIDPHYFMKPCCGAK